MKFKKVISFILAAGMVFSAAVMPSSENSGIAITASAASAALAAPKNIKAAVGTDKITLKWDKVSGADAYRVYLYDSYNKKYRSVKTVTDTKAAITGLLSEQKYYFKICALKKTNGKYSEGEKYSFGYTTKSIGDKNIVLKEIYIPWGNKSGDEAYKIDYDNNGRIKKVKFYANNDGGYCDYSFKEDTVMWQECDVQYKDNTIIFTRKYKENNIVSSDPSSTITTIKYDKNYNITSEIYQSGKYKYTTTYSYKYNKKGELVSKSYVQKGEPESDDRDVVYENAGTYESPVIKYKYDKNGNLTSVTGLDYYKDAYASYTYDKNGKLIKEYKNNGYEITTSYIYDKNGNLVKEISKYSSDFHGEYQNEKEYKYYSNGKIKSFVDTKTRNNKKYIDNQAYYVYESVKKLDENTERVNEMILDYFRIS